ncbi:MAG: cyanophycinase [Bacillota bacterium]
MNLERLGSITSELSSNLIKSIVVPPGGLLGWFTRHRAERARERQRVLRPELRADDALALCMAEFPVGPVVLLGGTPVPDEAVVESIHLAGGRSIKMAIIPVAATSDPAATSVEASRLFTRFGMKKVELFELDSREKATSAQWCARLAEYDAVVLCGENPAQGLQVLQATLAAVTLRDMAQVGKLIVGLDAGAAILGSRVFPGSEGEEATAGLGLLPGLLLDTAFTQCSRFSRMARAMTTDDGCYLLGTGLDSGSALVIQGGEAKVLGEASVTFLDPRDRTAGGEELPNGLKVHLLTEGFRMNLRLRRTIAPQKREALAR